MAGSSGSSEGRGPSEEIMAGQGVDAATTPGHVNAESAAIPDSESSAQTKAAQPTKLPVNTAVLFSHAIQRPPTDAAVQLPPIDSTKALGALSTAHGEAAIAKTARMISHAQVGAHGLDAHVPPPVPLAALARRQSTTAGPLPPTFFRPRSVPPPSPGPLLSPLSASMLQPPQLVRMRGITPPTASKSRAALVAIVMSVVALGSLTFAAVLAWQMHSQSTQVAALPAAPSLPPATPVHESTAGPAVEPVAPTRTEGRRGAGARSRNRSSAPAISRAAVAARANIAPPRGSASTADGEENAPDAARSACARNCHGDIDCVLRCTVSTVRSAPAPRGNSAAASDDSDTGSDLPALPSRADVQRALHAVDDAVQRCASGRPGSADVDVSIAGSGHVTTAVVAPPYSGTSEGSCIARVVRTAQLPAFSQRLIHVRYTYRIE